MTTQQRLAILIDLHPPSSSSTSPSRSSANTDNHKNLVKNKINDLLVDDQASFIKLYLLTPPEGQAGVDFNQVIPSDERVEAAVIRADDKTAGFYEAKQDLDNLELRDMKLVCDDGRQRFWNDVCRLLLTPVHKWSVTTFAGSPMEGEGSSPKSPPGQILNGSQNTPDNATRSQHSTSSKNSQMSDPSTRTHVQQFLQTLPSLLGVPEVDRSKVLPGLGAGFVHGYSTRRGGVTKLPTLCSMNMVYTDLKPDSQLVIEENRRRLASVGGFDYQNFHITRVEHGHRVWVIGEEQPLKFDALVTDRRDITIAAAGADCIPLLFADPVAMVIGAAHAGWKGTIERVAGCVVNTMKERFGSRPEDIRVAMGPGVRPGCFVVPVEDQELFTVIHPSCVMQAPDTSSHKIEGVFQQTARVGRAEGDDSSKAASDQQELQISPIPTPQSDTIADQSVAGVDVGEALTGSVVGTGSGDIKQTAEALSRSSAIPQSEFKVKLIPTEQLRPRKPRSPKDPNREWVNVDLQLTNYHVLLQAGVKAEHIDMSTSHCTRCNTDLYFSNERDGFPFGNQIGFLYMPSVL